MFYVIKMIHFCNHATVADRDDRGLESQQWQTSKFTSRSKQCNSNVLRSVYTHIYISRCGMCHRLLFARHQSVRGVGLLIPDIPPFVSRPINSDCLSVCALARKFRNARRSSNVSFPINRSACRLIRRLVSSLNIYLPNDSAQIPRTRREIKMCQYRLDLRRNAESHVCAGARSTRDTIQDVPQLAVQSRNSACKRKERVEKIFVKLLKPLFSLENLSIFCTVNARIFYEMYGMIFLRRFQENKL